MMMLLVSLLVGGMPAARNAGCRACHTAVSHPTGPAESREIPAFARKYRTSCSTCHTAAPKLNVLGEAFRLNGYRFPENDQLLRKDEPVPLGEDPWKDLWPRSIWPGELPASVPLAVRIQTDLGVLRDRRGSTRTDLRMPHEVYLLAGTTLGEGIGTFVETEWSREEGLEVIQAKVLFQDALGLAPDRALNIWVGLQNLYLFSFADRQIDRAGRQMFRWQNFQPAQLAGPAGLAPPPSTDQFSLFESQPAIELNGLFGSRVSYGLGLSQGAGETTEDNNARKDVYYRVRWKLGGLGLDGRYPPGVTPPLNGRGQLRDRSLTLEHFGYVGAEPAAGDVADDHRHFGLAARALWGSLDAGAGYVWGRYDAPWGIDAAAAVEVRSLFAKIEVIALPWLIPSLKLERFDAEPAGAPAGIGLPLERQTRVIPGIIALIRQNIRGVLEAEFVPRFTTTDSPGTRHPFALWTRLDVAF